MYREKNTEFDLIKKLRKIKDRIFCLFQLDLISFIYFIPTSFIFVPISPSLVSVRCVDFNCIIKNHNIIKEVKKLN
jgi:hypothetical protein